MIIPFRHAKHRALIESKQDALAQAIMEVYAHCPVQDLLLAIGAGMRAIERGENFQDAMDAVEGVMNICRDWEQIDTFYRRTIMAQRNRERLTNYRIKRTGYELFKFAVEHTRSAAGEK